MIVEVSGGESEYLFLKSEYRTKYSVLLNFFSYSISIETM